MHLMPKVYWPSWFALLKDASTIIHDLCFQLIKLQFKSTSDLNLIYPDVKNKNKNKICKQKTIYNKVFQKIIKEFEKKIGQLKKL